MPFNNDEQSNTKNLVIALVLFGALIFGFNYFFESSPQNEEVKTEEIQKIEEGSVEGGETPDKGISVKEAISKESRVSVENGCVVGSIDLIGGIIDNVTLKNYKQAVSKDSANVMLLTPKNTECEFYYEIYYNDKTNNENLSEKTVWIADDERKSNGEVNLKTQTQNGLVVERKISLDDGYLINVTDRVKNASTSDIKISANSSLVRRNPNVSNYAVVHEGLVGNSSESIDEIKYKNIEGKTKLSGSDWFGYTDIYWLCSIINRDKKYSISYSKFGDNSYSVSADTKEDVTIAPNSEVELKYSIFTGPKDIGVLKKYGNKMGLDKFDMAIDFGWFFMVTKPLIHFMEILAKIFSNMGLVVLILTLIFKIITYPLVRKSFTSIAKMKELQPKITNLQKLYSGDKVKLNQELVSLYKREGVSPLSGCLPMLLQAPVFFCLYKVFFVSIQMRHAPLFGWIHDLSAPDQLYIFNLFGLIDWVPPSFLQIGVWPLIMGLTMFLQQKLTTAKASKTAEKTSEQKMQENMMLFMPVMFTYICSSFPVAVVIYWTISNLIGIALQYHTNKRLKR
ncbi:MAG: membrane protein insertase YidC [Holosporales bacterium]|jgi:YidC/Oxa1 family membrane protein insertase|nr:membrane protein insertase YidC [Holosporales bacterium]